MKVKRNLFELYLEATCTGKQSHQIGLQFASGATEDFRSSREALLTGKNLSFDKSLKL